MAKNKKIPRAGLIPYFYKNGQLMMLFMKPSNTKFGGSQFQVAKGKIESGETAEIAAVREASEELGLRIENLISICHLGTFLGYTEVFFGEVKDMHDFGETTSETDETAWLTEGEFRIWGRPLHLPIVKSFIGIITVVEPFQQNHLC